MILQKIKTSINKIFFPIFGNTLGIPLNIKWILYRFNCRIIYLIKNKNIKKLSNYDYENYKLCKINKSDTRDLSVRIVIQITGAELLRKVLSQTKYEKYYRPDYRCIRVLIFTRTPLSVLVLVSTVRH